VRDRNSDKMNQREREADCERREALRRALICCAKDDQQEKESEHSLTQETRRQRISSWGMHAITIRCKARSEAEARFSRRNHKHQSGSGNATEYLRGDIRRQLRC